VVGGDESTRQRVEALVAPVLASRPLKLEVIEHALLTANDIPGANVSGLLRPSATEPGASDLVVTVSSQPYTVLLSTDNRSAKSNGMWTESVDLAARSPLGDGGQILLNASSALDVNQRYSMQGKYVALVGDSGATVSMSGLVSHGQPAGAVANLRLVSNSIATGPHVSYPLIVGRQERLSIESGLTWQSADTHVLGSPYSHDEWRVADIALAYQNSRLFDGVNNATVDLAKGLDILGASKAGNADLSRPGGRPDFTKMTTQLRRVQTLDGPLSLSITGSGQYAFNTLLTSEEMSFGGPQIGRGYDPAAITADNGLGGAFELRYDLDASDLYLDQAQLYTFYDTAKVWVHTGRIGENNLQSTGGGLRTVVFKDLSLAVELARTLLPVATSGNGKRDSRVFFNGSIKF
jgi:hemolysin activation/secretion protein